MGFLAGLGRAKGGFPAGPTAQANFQKAGVTWRVEKDMRQEASWIRTGAELNVAPWKSVTILAGLSRGPLPSWQAREDRHLHGLRYGSRLYVLLSWELVAQHGQCEP